MGDRVWPWGEGTGAGGGAVGGAGAVQGAGGRGLLGQGAELLLTVGAGWVRLSGGGVDVSARHGGVRPGLANAVDDVRRVRARAGVRRVVAAVNPALIEMTRRGGSSPVDQARIAAAGGMGDASWAGGMSVSLRRAGGFLAESFLPAPVSEALAAVLGRAESVGVPVRLGVQPFGEMTRLPWEALADPVSGTPLALHPWVAMYRRAVLRDGLPGVRPGPLRIVVAVAAPSSGGGALLDYEGELRAVLAAVRGARAGHAQVEVVPFATTAQIRQALSGGDVHVLHVSGHAEPGRLHLENEDGGARAVTAEQFFNEAIPETGVPAVVALAACHTGELVDASTLSFAEVSESSQSLSFAGELVARGVPAVIATETSVTDRYATRVFARVYAELAQARVPDVVVALTMARRQVQQELARSQNPRDRAVAGLDEWGVVTVLAHQASTLVLDPDRRRPVPGKPVQGEGTGRSAGGGLVAREVGQFVGRRAEQRSLPVVLAGNPLRGVTWHGVLLHGIGGIGKTTLAAEVLARAVQRDPGRPVVTVTGATTVDGVFAAVAAALRGPLHALAVSADRSAGGSSLARQALDGLQQFDRPWEERWEGLREHVLNAVPLLLVLDNFEDNLTDPNDSKSLSDPAGQVAPRGGRELRDPALAGLLAEWMQAPESSRLLVTCRYPIALPGHAHRLLLTHHLGPLTLAETLKMVWSLPRLDALDEADLERLWRGVGGHPRALEYVDALLAQGQARFADVTARLEAQARLALGGNAAREWFARQRSLNEAVAEVVTLAADEVLLPDLLAAVANTPGAEQALLGLSVYRRAVDRNALLFQIGSEDETTGQTPDQQAAYEQISAALSDHGVDMADLQRALDAGDLSQLPADLLQEISPALNDLLAPPCTTGANVDLNRVVAVLVASSLLSPGPRAGLFVHRWTADGLARHWRATGRGDEVRVAHRRAADYWQWRAEHWPQDQFARVADLLEARYHLLEGDDLAEAVDITREIREHLREWGAWDDETRLVHDTLARLASDDGRRAFWLLELGTLAWLRGDPSEAERRYHQGLQLFEEQGDQAGATDGHFGLGVLASSRGDYREAERRYRRSRQICEELGDQSGIAESHLALGLLAWARGDSAEAARHYGRALQTFDELGNRAGVARAHQYLGVLAQDRADYAEAERLYEQAVTLREELGDRAGVANGQLALGSLAWSRADVAEAERRYRQALQIREEMGDRARAVRHLDLGWLARRRGDHEEAERRDRQALQIGEDMGDRVGAARGYDRLGGVAQDRGDVAEAERRYRQALEIWEKLGNRASAAAGYLRLGQLAQGRGDLAEAERRYGQALQIYEELGDRAGAAAGYLGLGALARDRGDGAEAERHFQQVLAVYEELGNRAGAAAGYLGLGLLARDRGDVAEAERRYEQALQDFEALRDLYRVAVTLIGLGGLARDRGDFAEAERRYRQALQIYEELGDGAHAAAVRHELGVLAQLHEQWRDAVVWFVKAFTLRRELATPDAAIDAAVLNELRAQKDVEDFAQATATVVGREGVLALLTLLDDYLHDDR